jgi:hypothetical protein
MNSFRAYLPIFAKRVFRFLRYPEERTRFFREYRIKKEQDRLLRDFDANTRSLIIFFVPGADRKTGKETISGGVISIVSLCEETAALKDVHDSLTIMCTFPGDFLLSRYINFDNTTHLHRFSGVTRRFKNVKKLIIHLPEFQVPFFEAGMSKGEKKWVQGIKEVHLNIINANILLMPGKESIDTLAAIANKITITAAHSKYCSAHYRELFGYPLHKFSAWISPEQYRFRPYSSKEDIMVVSPDENPHREKILGIIKQNTRLEIIVLQNLTYAEFKKIIGRAKWALTFGEGLDGYILEPIFSGTLGFAAYNEDFFTEPYKNMKGIYPTYDDMAARIVQDIQLIDNSSSYSIFQKEQFEVCARDYSYSEYQSNIRAFYLGKYTFM